jgi:O-antigen/teichoic acid export membrane protein
MGGQAGLFQGERLWTPLALIYLTSGVGRLAFGGLGLLVRPDAFGAMCGVAVGAFVPVGIGWWALRGRPSRADRTALPGQGVVRETLHNSHALLAFFALSNVDVVLARALLDQHQAGLYAGGLILTKAVLFLPQFVIVVAFPSMSRSNASRRLTAIALTMVAGIGLVTVSGVALLPDLALAFVGGPGYSEVTDQLWAFAALGTILAMTQMMVYGVVASQGRRTVYLIWSAMAAVAVVATLVGTSTEMLTGVILVNALLLILLVTLVSRAPSRASNAATPDVAPEPKAGVDNRS